MEEIIDAQDFLPNSFSSAFRHPSENLPCTKLFAKLVFPLNSMIYEPQYKYLNSLLPALQFSFSNQQFLVWLCFVLFCLFLSLLFFFLKHAAEHLSHFPKQCYFLGVKLQMVEVLQLTCGSHSLL